MNITRSATFATSLFLALAFAACASPQEKAVDASQARVDADQQMNEINLETQQKEAALQLKAAQDSDDNAREGAKKMNAADSVANEKAMEAVDALLKARADVREVASKKRDGLDKDVIDLRTKIETKLSPSDQEAVQRMLRVKSYAVREAIVDVNSTSVDTLEGAKNTIDARLAEFEAAILDTKKRLD